MIFLRRSKLPIMLLKSLCLPKLELGREQRVGGSGFSNSFWNPRHALPSSPSPITGYYLVSIPTGRHEVYRMSCKLSASPECVYRLGVAEYGGIVLLEEIKPNVETPVCFEFAFNCLLRFPLREWQETLVLSVMWSLKGMWFALLWVNTQLVSPNAGWALATSRWNSETNKHIHGL